MSEFSGTPEITVCRQDTGEPVSLHASGGRKATLVWWPEHRGLALMHAVEAQDWSAEREARFADEAGSAASRTGDWLPVLWAGDYDGKKAFFTPVGDGEPLADYAKRVGALPEAVALRMVLGWLESLGLTTWPKIWPSRLATGFVVVADAERGMKLVLVDPGFAGGPAESGTGAQLAEQWSRELADVTARLLTGGADLAASEERRGGRIVGTGWPPVLNSWMREMRSPSANAPFWEVGRVTGVLRDAYASVTRGLGGPRGWTAEKMASCAPQSAFAPLLPDREEIALEVGGVGFEIDNDRLPPTASVTPLRRVADGKPYFFCCRLAAPLLPDAATVAPGGRTPQSDGAWVKIAYRLQGYGYTAVIAEDVTGLSLAGLLAERKSLDVSDVVTLLEKIAPVIESAHSDDVDLSTGGMTLFFRTELSRVEMERLKTRKLALWPEFLVKLRRFRGMDSLLAGAGGAPGSGLAESGRLAWRLMEFARHLLSHGHVGQSGAGLSEPVARVLRDFATDLRSGAKLGPADLVGRLRLVADPVGAAPAAGPPSGHRSIADQAREAAARRKTAYGSM